MRVSVSEHLLNVPEGGGGQGGGGEGGGPGITPAPAPSCLPGHHCVITTPENQHSLTEAPV